MMSVYQFVYRCRPCLSSARKFPVVFHQMFKSYLGSKPSTSSKIAVRYGSADQPHMPAILRQMREDVLMDPIYKGQVIFLKKNWTFMSSTSDSVLSQLKTSAAENSEGRNMTLLALSDSDLVKLVTELAHLQEMYQLEKLLPVIEAECCFRACSLDSLSLLAIADAFYMMEYQFWKYFSTLMSQFELRWESLAVSKKNVLQFLFYMSYLRKAPIQLMHKVETFMNDNSDELSGNEFGLVCHTFFSTNTAFRNYALLDKISHATLQDLRKSEVRPYMLSNILKSLKHARFLDIKFYDELGEILPKVKRAKIYATVNDYANVASGYSSLKIVNSELFAFINTSLRKLSKEANVVRKLRTKDLHRLVWSFGLLREPLDGAVFTILIDKLKSDPELAYKYPEAFVEALMSLAMYEVYPGELIDVLFSQSFGKMKSKRLLEQKYQLLLIETAYKIDGQGCKNLQELRRSKFGGPVGSLEHDLATRQGLMSLAGALSDKLTPGCLKCHFILPHSRITDIEIRLDSRNQPQSFNTELTDVAAMNKAKEHSRVYSGSKQDSIVKQILEKSDVVARQTPENMHLTSEMSNSNRRISIKLAGWNQFAANKPMLLGNHQMELRLLTRLGYDVYMINPEEAQRVDAMNASERSRYVDNLCRVLNIFVRPKTATAIKTARRH